MTVVNAAFRPTEPSVSVHHGHAHIKTRQIIAASHLTAYVVRYGCAGTRVTVTEGLVDVTWLRGRHRTVHVSAGHSYLAPARPATK